MCGIAGYIGSRQLQKEHIDNCLKLMKRRGPDSSAVYYNLSPKNRHVYLLHSRLNIIDLNERANQPFRLGSKVMVFNGELYNYLELKKELMAENHQFKTTSDTEVLLQIIDKYDCQGLDRCEGMWAFAVYDEAHGSLLLSRDRFGEKPLYLYQDATGLYFGSEVKFIQALIERRLELNIEHLYRYMVNGYKALYKNGQTFFKGLSELPAASILHTDGVVEKKQKYWRPAFNPEESMTYDEAVEGAREQLIRAVKVRLRADVPLAFCMSGGVDSNSLISIAKKVFNYDVHGFTIVNSDERYEEQDMVNHSVKELNIRHTSIPVDTTDFIPKLRTLVRQHDAPVYTITYYAHWLLMQSVAEQGYRISISGSAADELFTGYFDHHLAYLYEIKDENGLYSSSLQAWNKYIKPIVRNPYLKNPDLFINDRDTREHIYLNADKFSGYLSTHWSESFYEKDFTDSLLRNRMMNELFHEATPVILHEDDLNAMYYSIENRSPFLDRGLFEFCYSVPSKHLIQDGRTKAVLRDAMKGIVPEPVRTNRRKVGFNAPIFSYLDINDPEVRSYLLGDSPIFEHVKRKKIEQLIAKDSLPNSESKFLFNFLNSKIFLEEYSN